LVEMHESLKEIFVNFNNGFTEELRPASQELQNYFEEQNIVLPKGYRTEINLEALEWLNDISVHLASGYVITIDYGYTASEYYSAKRNLGTLACYYQHTVTGNLYENIGKQDITAHVNFSALAIWGKKYGLDFTGYCNQNYFLRSLGLASFLRKVELENVADKGKLIQINKLLFDMGDKFKVLIQQKGIATKLLTGMQFSQHNFL
ncbi:MAG: SAM-dependent methyltransferase, partial [Ginsengibacter sp.]